MAIEHSGVLPIFEKLSWIYNSLSNGRRVGARNLIHLIFGGEKRLESENPPNGLGLYCRLCVDHIWVCILRVAAVAYIER